jgi:uncharacterized membrane protein YgdD (TMEM256/DUF423 family)
MINFDKKIVVTGAILAALAIGLGALGAHSLKTMISANSLITFETGVRYQIYHALALSIIGFAVVIPAATRKWVFIFFLFGCVFFSGSIYLLALKEILPFEVSFLWPITPLGGILFIMGWLRLAYGLIIIK